MRFWYNHISYKTSEEFCRFSSFDRHWAWRIRIFLLTTPYPFCIPWIGILPGQAVPFLPQECIREKLR